ncbi:MAG: hypothetical protein ACI83D_000348 [Planctomycetota bacterium]|jgi:hypothetical protein
MKRKRIFSISIFLLGLCASTSTHAQMAGLDPAHSPSRDMAVQIATSTIREAETLIADRTFWGISLDSLSRFSQRIYAAERILIKLPEDDSTTQKKLEIELRHEIGWRSSFFGELLQVRKQEPQHGNSASREFKNEKACHMSRYPQIYYPGVFEEN